MMYKWGLTVKKKCQYAVEMLEAVHQRCKDRSTEGVGCVGGDVPLFTGGGVFIGEY